MLCPISAVSSSFLGGVLVDGIGEILVDGELAMMNAEYDISFCSRRMFFDQSI